MTNVRAYRNVQPKLGANVYVDPAATVIGDVELGDDVSIWPGAVLRGDVERIRIGARTNVQDGSVVHVTHDGPYTPGGQPCIVGADVTIGHGAVIHACTIEDCCLIGMHATVLDGAVVKRHAFVGAGALVAPGQGGRRRRAVGRQPRALRALVVRDRNRGAALFGAALRRTQERLSSLILASAASTSGRTRCQRSNDAAAVSTSMPRPSNAAAQPARLAQPVKGRAAGP